MWQILDLRQEWQNYNQEVMMPEVKRTGLYVRMKAKGMKEKWGIFPPKNFL